MSQTDTMKSSADVVALDDARQKRSEATEADLATAGGMLRAAREAMGLTTRDVADRTNIRIDNVEALENMELKALPAPAYTMGFVRAFAREVNLPEDALMERFREQAGFLKPAEAPRVKSVSASGEAMDGGRELSVLALIAIVAFFLWAAWSLLMRSEPQADPLASRFEATPAAQEDVPASGTEEISAEIEQPSTDAATDVTSEAPEPAAETTVDPSVADEPVEADPVASETEPANSEAPQEPVEDVAAPPVQEPVVEEVIALRRVDAIDPVYPPLCESDAADIETVRVRYSVNRSGLPVSPRVINSTNPCFNGAAVTALVRWRYASSTVTPENSRGLTTTFTFERPF